MMIGTGSQTVGPFFHVGLCTLFNDKLVDARFAGPLITIRGRVLDGDGAGVADAMVEIWQADPTGEYATSERHDGFSGFGRVPTGADGSFQFTTTRPGRVAGPDGKLQAPHIVVAIFMRGLLRHLNSRIYFPDGAGNSEDLVLSLVEPGRRGTLVAREVATGTFEWDVRLQGESETVFFDF
jgi:protocatechuate 3,4-dioxygenase alpha subunit